MKPNAQPLTTRRGRSLVGVLLGATVCLSAGAALSQVSLLPCEQGGKLQCFLAGQPVSASAMNHNFAQLVRDTRAASLVGSVVAYAGPVSAAEEELPACAANAVQASPCPEGADCDGDCVPDEFVLADGRQLAACRYPALFEALEGRPLPQNGCPTIVLPDYRGVFLRGHGGRDPDRNRRLGDLQDSANRGHAHGASASAVGNHSHGPPNRACQATQNRNGTAVALTFGCSNHLRQTPDFTTQGAGGHSHSITVQSDGIVEARPINRTVNFLIRVK